MRKSIGFLGGGQLGMMMGEAAKGLGYEVGFLDPSPTACARRVGKLISIRKDFDDEVLLRRFVSHYPIVTYEWENVPMMAVKRLEKLAQRLHPNSQVLRIASNRLLEKQMFESLSIPQPLFHLVNSYEELRGSACSHVGLPMILKTVTGGYDGIGQCRIGPEHTSENIRELWAKLARQVPLIAEQQIDFDQEVSQIAVRSETGEILFYPLMQNSHHEGILRQTRALPVNNPLMSQAQDYTRQILEHFDYVGVMCVEFFALNGKLFANEIAPRVHNSGHLTIEGAKTSQFENHIRALVGMPLGPTDIECHVGMINIIGTLPRSMTGHDHVYWHLYGKEERPRRKIGHVTVVHSDHPEFNALVAEVQHQVEGNSHIMDTV